MARPVRAAASASAAKAILPSPSSSVVRGKRSAPQSQPSPSASARSKRQKKEDVQSDSDAIDEDDDGDDDLEVTSTSSEDSGDAADDYKDPGSGDAHESDDDEDGSDGGDDDDSTMDDADLEDEELDSDAPKTKKNGSKGSKGKGRASSSATGNGSASKGKATVGKPKKEESSEDEEETLKDGRKVIRTKLVKAPSGHVKPGLIDPRTMEFLGELVQNNEREWFAKNDARYRHALQNWQQFVDAVQPVIQKGDWSIPEMPAKDLIHRIYRDVRFSNDKTPYKKNFSASFSRAGRKGPFAGYYLQISPNGRSLLAGGKWGPEKNDLATIRSNILRSSKPLRKVINDPKFVSLFGPAKLPAGKKAPSNSAAGISRRCNVFGSDDMLKVAPKINGVDKTHKDIDLLRLRTIAVVYEFKDEEVIKDTFMDRIGEVVEAMAPLVLLLNEMLHPTSEDEAEAENDNEDDEEVEGEGGSAGEDDEAGGIESA